MNNNIFTLTKIFFKNGSGEANKKRKHSTILIGIVLAMCFLPLAISIGGFFASAYDIMKVLNQEAVLAALALAVSAMMIFFFGIFYIINTFYFSNDVEYLLPLPLRPSEILGAKFIQVVVYEYLTELVVLLPVLIGFGIKSSAGILYYIYSLMIFLILPVLPLALAAFLIMLLMRFSELFKNKDRFRMVSGIAALFIAIGFNIFMQKFTQNAVNPENMQNIVLKGDNSLTSIVSKIFPGIRWAADALAYSTKSSGLIGLSVFIVISIAAFILFLLIGNILYFKGVLNLSDNTARRRKMTGKDISRSVTRSSVMKAYVVKELKLLVRTPSYFINCIMMNFVWPLLLLIPMFTQPDFMKTIAAIKDFVNNPGYSGLQVAIGFGFIMFLVSINGVASTAISREGQNLFICKYLPVSYRDQIMAKVFSGVAVSLFGLLTVLIVAAAVLQVSPIIILIMLISGVLGIFFNCFTGIIIDLNNPKLNWDNEQKAVKQNLNLMLNMLLGAAFGGLVILAQVKLKPEYGILSILLVIILLLLDIILYKIILVKGDRLFERLED